MDSAPIVTIGLFFYFSCVSGVLVLSQLGRGNARGITAELWRIRMNDRGEWV